MGWTRESTEEEERRRLEEINRAGEEAREAPPPEPDTHREGIDYFCFQAKSRVTASPFTSSRGWLRWL